MVRLSMSVGRKIGVAPTVASSIALIAFVFAIRLWLLRFREFDPDEFQHLHAAWNIAHGLTPYRDYFEHHMPTLHFMLARLFGMLSNSWTEAAVIDLPTFSRAVMWVCAVVCVVLTGL